MTISENEYISIHKWLKKHHGKASRCEDCSKPAKRFEWALKKGLEHERKRENYRELCPSCHRKYDITETMISNLRRARRSKIHEDPIERIRIGGREFNSTKEASEELGINRRSIYNVLAGRAKRVGGYTVIKL